MTYDTDDEGFPDDSDGRLPLHFFWILDCSGKGQKISELNAAIREVLPEIRKVADDNLSVNVFMRAIAFSSNVNWHIGPDPVNLADFSWIDLASGGARSTASAINFLCEELEPSKLKRYALPVCILISDGYCTESEDSYSRAIERLNNNKVGKRAIRMSIAVGQEGEYDEAQLAMFGNQDVNVLLKARTPEELVGSMFGNQDVNVLKARTPEELVGSIKWAAMSSVSIDPHYAERPLPASLLDDNHDMPKFEDSDEVDLF